MIHFHTLSNKIVSHSHSRNLAAAPRPVRRARGVTVCAAAGQSADGDDDEDDGEASVAGRPMRVERLLANLGYGKRRECQMLVKKGRVTTCEGGKLKVGDKVFWGDVVLDGEDLDPPSPLLVALNKPTGYVVTSPDDEKITDPVVYDLLPYRFGRRRPFLSCVGRLDKDTSGLLLLTDDGALLHRINSPKRGIWKVYEATLAEPLSPRQAEAAARKFASGTLVLEGDYTPLLPARLEMTGDRSGRVSICEGRYHQVRRMFAAVGGKVVALHRISVGGLSLGSLPEGEWRYLEPQELELVFEGPSTEDVLRGRGGGTAGGSGATADGNSATPAAKLGTGAGGDSAAAGYAAVASSSATGASDGASSGGMAAVVRDRSRSASGGGGGGKGGDDGERLTKKEKKKGKKVAGRREQQGRSSSGEGGGKDGEEGEEEDDGEDVELLLYDDDDPGNEAGGQGEAAGGRRSRRKRRPLAVRQGAVLDRRGESIDELIVAEVPYGDDAEAGAVMSTGASAGIRKYRDDAKWLRRREALRQLLPP